MTNPNARNRARRKNPLRRAVGAPRVKPEPVGCPLGRCEHVAMLHKSCLAGHAGPDSPIEGARCEAPGCDCEGAL